MLVHVPYTVILQDDTTGSVSSEVINAPNDTLEAQRYVTSRCQEGMHVVALVKGEHPVVPGIPTNV